MMFPNPARGRERSIFPLLVLLAAALILTAASRASARPQWQQKVDRWVLDAAAAEADVSFLVILREQADLSAAAAAGDKTARGRAVYETLTDVARRTQAPILADLRAAGIEHRPYWISNMIWVRGDGALVERLARRADVARLYANPWTKLDVVAAGEGQSRQQSTAGVEWNVALIGAPEVWAAGYTGQGAVIGGQDTGYDWTHPALQDRYRGWDGAAASHDYNWHDAIHEDNPNTLPGNSCGYDSPEPCDDHGHGTHTMGTMVGAAGANQIGVAPGAQWIACRNMENGFGTPASYAECYEWFVAPYPYGGDPFSDGDPARAPHVVNNSWSCPDYEGCSDPQILREVVEHVRAAGILTVHSAGNEGPNCGTILSPAANYEASFTVGATEADDMIAGFSNRGPAGGLRKPDISAPGVRVFSSIPGAGYTWMSGTSMAAPHVAGMAALLISAEPALAGDVDALEQIIEQTAVPRFSEEGCGGDGPETRPNHVYGWGRVDALAAYHSLAAQANEIYTPFLITP